LDTETQLWLVDYLQQHCYWQQFLQDQLWHRPEQLARRYLLSYAQPRLVWNAHC